MNSDVGGRGISVDDLEYGVYIQDTTGRFWTEDLWDGSATVAGYAIYTDEAAFVLSKSNYAQNYPLIRRSSGYISNTIMTEYGDDYDIAKLDFIGLANTEALYRTNTSSSAGTSLVGWCQSHFPLDYSVPSYVLSAGEFNVMINHKSDIAKLANLTDGDVNLLGTQFTSTYYGISDYYNTGSFYGVTNNGITSEVSFSDTAWIRCGWPIFYTKWNSGTWNIASVTMDSYKRFVVSLQYPADCNVGVVIKVTDQYNALWYIPIQIAKGDSEGYSVQCYSQFQGTFSYTIWGKYPVSNSIYRFS